MATHRATLLDADAITSFKDQQSALMHATGGPCVMIWSHGAAATEFGPGHLAEHLPDLLPRVLRRLVGN